MLRVQVLNGSGVAGAAGRLTNKLSQAGFDVLPAGNAPRRYSASAIYYAEGWLAEAKEILAEADIEEIEEPTAMPQQFATEEAVVVVLLGTDTAPARAQASLRPRQRNNVKLPLGDDVPRDRYVPGLSNINMYSELNFNEQNEGTELSQRLYDFRAWLSALGKHVPEDIPGMIVITPDQRQTRQGFLELIQLIEEDLEWFGFTPQNVCGAPAGYSFSDLWQPTREWDEDLKLHGGLKLPTTTDMLLEWHGGERINPEANLDFYIQQAVQTAHDSYRLFELGEEVVTQQMILCAAWKRPAHDIPVYAYYSLINLMSAAFVPSGTFPLETLKSQEFTYHFKAISRNGNFAYLVRCHPTDEPKFIMLWWRKAGYRTEYISFKKHGYVPGTGGLGPQPSFEDYPSGCQEMFDEYDDILSGQVPDEWTDRYWTEDLIFFNFGERVFSGSDLLDFPRG